MINEDVIIRVALIQCDYVLLEKGNLDTEIDTRTGRMQNEDEGRHVVMYVSVKECQRLAAKHQKLRWRHETDISSQPSKETSHDILIINV